MTDTYFSVSNIQSLCKLGKILVDMHRLQATPISSETLVQRNSEALVQLHSDISSHRSCQHTADLLIQCENSN